MKAVVVGSMALALAGCSDRWSGASNAPTPTEREAPVAAPAPPPTPPAPVRGREVAIERKDGVLEFAYGWPGAAAAVPPLGAWLRAHADRQYEAAHKEAEEGRRGAKDGGFPFHAYSFEQHWSVAADTPAVLVLESEGYSFTGGAHGMPFFASLIWDRAAGKRLGTAEVLDVAALARAAKPAFCTELDRQRAEKRGAPVNPQADDGVPEFTRCAEPAEQEILPFSRGGKALDAVRFVIGPYVAGPYAEGPYVIELPMTPAMLATVKPAARAWFAPGSR